MSRIGAARCARIAAGAGLIAFRAWLGRRRFPLLAMAALIAAGIFTTTWGSALTRTWEAKLTGKPAFALPADLWSTLIAAR